MYALTHFTQLEGHPSVNLHIDLKRQTLEILQLWGTTYSNTTAFLQEPPAEPSSCFWQFLDFIHVKLFVFSILCKYSRPLVSKRFNDIHIFSLYETNKIQVILNLLGERTFIQLLLVESFSSVWFYFVYVSTWGRPIWLLCGRRLWPGYWLRIVEHHRWIMFLTQSWKRLCSLLQDCPFLILKGAPFY